MNNPLILIFLGLALCIDIRLAGAFIVLVGIFAALTRY
jgi:hypothetical protein